MPMHRVNDPSNSSMRHGMDLGGQPDHLQSSNQFHHRGSQYRDVNHSSNKMNQIQMAPQSEEGLNASLFSPDQSYPYQMQPPWYFEPPSPDSPQLHLYHSEGIQPDLRGRKNVQHMPYQQQQSQLHIPYEQMQSPQLYQQMLSPSSQVVPSNRLQQFYTQYGSESPIHPHSFPTQQQHHHAQVPTDYHPHSQPQIHQSSQLHPTQQQHLQQYRPQHYQQQHGLMQQSAAPPMNLFDHGTALNHYELNDTSVYQVQFKRRVAEYVSADHRSYMEGDFVIVSAEPFGEDLGIVVGVLTQEEHQIQAQMTASEQRKQHRKIHPSGVGKVLRMATIAERQKLPMKHHAEDIALQHCQQVSYDILHLPMIVFDAEYTFDRTKLTFFYNSEVHIDFRELVKELYSRYKTRIWMKKMNQEPPFFPKEFALVELLTGAQIGTH